MLSHYRIVHRKQDVGMRISSLYRQQQLAIGILDMGTMDELKATIDWYIANMNCCLHVVTTNERFEDGDFMNAYQDVTFLCFSAFVSVGESINAFADECYATNFLVVRTDCQIIGFEGAALMQQMGEKNHPAVITPYMLNQEGEIMPSLRAPYLNGKILDPLSFVPDAKLRHEEENLYPLMGLGLYDRALFQRMRGYDEQIGGEFYQLLDFGIRCFLFGYRIYTISDIALRFPSRHSVVEDRSPCDGMNRCYTKALSIHRIAGKNVVEKWKPYVDKPLFKDEVKKKLTILQKTDFFTLMANWKSHEA